MTFAAIEVCRQRCTTPVFEAAEYLEMLDKAGLAQTAQAPRTLLLWPNRPTRVYDTVGCGSYRRILCMNRFIPDGGNVHGASDH